MKYEVVISEQADRDIRELFEYIAFELLAPDNAAGQLNRLEMAIDSLAVYPLRHALYRVSPWMDRGLHIMPVDNYCVLYIVEESEARVSVLRVL